MKKKDFVKIVASKTGYRQVDIAYVIDTFIETLREAAVSGEKIGINNFLTIDVINCAETKRYSLANGRVEKVPSKRKLKATLSPTWEIE